jgi:hypothetical protein
MVWKMKHGDKHYLIILRSRENQVQYFNVRQTLHERLVSERERKTRTRCSYVISNFLSSVCLSLTSEENALLSACRYEVWESFASSKEELCSVNKL